MGSDVNSSAQHHISGGSHQVTVASYLQVLQVGGNKRVIELAAISITVTFHGQEIRHLLPPPMFGLFLCIVGIFPRSAHDNIVYKSCVSALIKQSPL
jgi:hypothetical protein